MTTTATKWIDAKGGKARALWLRVTLLASPATYGDGHNQWARVKYGHVRRRAQPVGPRAVRAAGRDCA